MALGKCSYELHDYKSKGTNIIVQYISLILPNLGNYPFSTHMLTSHCCLPIMGVASVKILRISEVSDCG